MTKKNLGECTGCGCEIDTAVTKKERRDASVLFGRPVNSGLLCVDCYPRFLTWYMAEAASAEGQTKH